MTEPTTILTVCLNAAVDVAYTAPGFTAGAINTVERASRTAGGKGNNVARVLAGLGQPVLATGFAGGGAGRFIIDDLQQAGVRTDFEEIAAESRTWTSIVDPGAGTVTGVREPGPALTEADADRFYRRFARLLDQAGLVILSGSLPPGIPEAFYAELISLAYRKSQLRTILDASGDALKQAIGAQPYLVKPNRAELEAWAGRPLPDEKAVLEAARRLMDAGPLVVAVTLGAEGLILVSPEGAWKAVPPAIRAVNTTGAGDAFVAGFAAGLMRGLPAEEILRLAVACGTASSLNAHVAVVDPRDLDRIRLQVKVSRIG